MRESDLMGDHELTYINRPKVTPDASLSKIWPYAGRSVESGATMV